MVATTDIKYFVFDNYNIPQLTNDFGCMIRVLDACLINGIPLPQVSSLTVNQNIATLTFNTAHLLRQYQVIEISGANESEFNIQHRILSVTSNSLTFGIVTNLTQATGVLAAKLPSLGWEKPFSSTSATGGKAAYRSKNTLLSSRPFLRVVDELDPAYTSTYAKFAKVGIVEDMTDIDVMLGAQAPYDSSNPNKNWVATGSGDSVINGWARWYYACSTESTNASYSIDYQTPQNGSNQWILVGSGDVFYIIPEVRPGYINGFIYGFGAFRSLIPIDNANTFLSTTLNNKSANDSLKNYERTPLGDDSNQTGILQRKYDNSANYSTYVAKSLNRDVYSGSQDILVRNQATGIAAIDPIILEEGNVARGMQPLIKWLYNSFPFQNLSIVKYESEIFIAKNIANRSRGGQILLKIGDL